MHNLRGGASDEQARQGAIQSTARFGRPTSLNSPGTRPANIVADGSAKVEFSGLDGRW